MYILIYQELDFESIFIAFKLAVFQYLYYKLKVNGVQKMGIAQISFK